MRQPDEDVIDRAPGDSVQPDRAVLGTVTVPGSVAATAGTVPQRPAPAPADTAAPGDDPDASGAQSTTVQQQRREEELRTESHHRVPHLVEVAALAAAAAIESARAVEPPAGDRPATNFDRTETWRRSTQTAQDAVDPTPAEADLALQQAAVLSDDSVNDLVAPGQPDAIGDDSIFSPADLDDFDDFDDLDASGLDQAAAFDLAAGTDLDRAVGFADLEPAGTGAAGLDTSPAPPVLGGPAEVGMPHPGATPWAGSTSIGTISSVDGDRVEQYAGRNEWTSFSIANDLHGVVPAVGQSVQINADGTMQATPEQQLERQQDRGLGLQL